MLFLTKGWFETSAGFLPTKDSTAVPAGVSRPNLPPDSTHIPCWSKSLRRRTISSADSIGLISKLLRASPAPLPIRTKGSAYQLTNPSIPPDTALPKMFF